MGVGEGKEVSNKSVGNAVGDWIGPMGEVFSGDTVSDAMAVGLVLGLEEGYNMLLGLGLVWSVGNSTTDAVGLLVGPVVGLAEGDSVGSSVGDIVSSA
jgi:hypothetical protein